ncbi:MAG TPA: serine/threonine-protein kinase, partial [Candidatus Obscuribacterales bacterium]
EIAAGGFAAIYLVRDDSGNQRILKESVLPQECDEATRERVKAQFVREATLLVRLSHPNIARVFDHFVELGRNYLILEYIEGADLRAHVRQHGRRSEEEALRWAAEIAETLSYLHQQEPPIVHRDITPDNLVLSPSGKVVLIDFGAANEFVGTATGTLIGKQSYMAPEQIRGKASPPSDLYSLGATIYFLLSGKDPEPLGVASIKAARADVSERTHQLIQDLTKLEQEQRISSAEAVLARIAECRDGLSRVPAG